MIEPDCHGNWRTMLGQISILNIIVLSLISLSPVIAQPQRKENPSERYIDAYLQYTDATCPLSDDDIDHFVYFARDRDGMRDHKFLELSHFQGAQIMYSWRQLEPTRGVYDFSVIHSDIEYLSSHGKTLFVQLQDTTFYDHNIGVPDYLRAEEFDGGIVQQRTDDGQTEGWVAKRWNPAVQERFSSLITELGQEFDGKIAGINLQESSIGVSQEFESSFTSERYVEGLKSNMLSMAQSFQESTTMQYANFIPGEWLPWEDNGYLRSIYAYGEEIGVGLGAPDLMVRRKGQLNHPLAMMHESEYTVPLGIAVQDGNYFGETNSNRLVTNRDNLVPMLHAFASDFLHVSYMFWSYQEPYFSEDVVPCFQATAVKH